MHDSGERKEQETGALSDPSHTNAAMELLSPYSLWQLSTWLGKGAKKYTSRNWEKGIPFSICIGKLQRHLQQYLAGRIDEPHLDAVGFWWHALTHYEAMITLGKLSASLNDLPQYEKKCDDNKPEVIGEFTVKKAQDTGKGWYIILTNTPCSGYGGMFLHKDLELYSYTGWTGGEAYGCAPGYYDNKEHAKSYIRMYKSKSFVVPKEWVITLNDATGTGGWYIVSPTIITHYLHRNLTLHTTTGWNDDIFGEAPGYWPTKEAAEDALRQYLESEVIK